MKIKKSSKDYNSKINFRFNILAIICISIFMVGIVGKTLQNDTYYTITLGKYILNNGIDMMEHFSWHEGLIYTYPHWLYDVFIYLIYNVFGFTGIYISSIVLGIFLGLSIYYVGSKLSKNSVLTFFITLLVMYLGKHYITARAQLVTFILFVWTIYFIEMFLDTKKKRYALGLILIPIAIANIHAAVFPFYFILYLPYIGEYIILLAKNSGTILTRFFMLLDNIKIDKLSKKEKLSEKQEKELKQLINRVNKNTEILKENRKIEKDGKEYKIIINKRENIKWLILIMVLCAFTGLITPIGDTPYTYLLHTMQGNTTGNIAEHLPLVLAQNNEAIIITVIYLVVLSFTKTKVKLSDLFLYLGLTVLMFKTRRQLSMVLFIGVFPLINMINTLIKKYDTNEEIESVKEKMVTITGQVVSYGLIAIITACLLITNKNDKIVSDTSYPIKACDYIIDNIDYKNNNVKIFNDYNYGSYLMYRGIPVFIDSRADVYDPKFNGLEDDIFQDYIRIQGLNVYYEDKFEHYGITHVMTQTNSKLSLYLNHDDNYKELYKDKSFTIYERLTDTK